MSTKRITSTQAQNNFGQVLNDASHNKTRYIVERHNVAQAIILSVDDIVELLENEIEREQIYTFLKGMKPQYALGEVLQSEDQETRLWYFTTTF